MSLVHQNINAEPDVYNDHTAIQMWLDSMGMMEHYDLFVKHGFADQMMTLSILTDKDLIDIGITKMAHRKKILLQIGNNKNMIGKMDGNGWEAPTVFPAAKSISINNNVHNEMYSNVNSGMGETPNVDTVGGQYETPNGNSPTVEEDQNDL
eukprot:UN09640